MHADARLARVCPSTSSIPRWVNSRPDICGAWGLPWASTSPTSTTSLPVEPISSPGTLAGAHLHIENRTRFPDVQEMAGAFNAKRAYLAGALAERVGVAAWASETHVIAALWSSEILHALRLRKESFCALCPDEVAPFDRWWAGEPPPRGRASILVVLDPMTSGRARPFVGLDSALRTRPRYKSYAQAAADLTRAS
jgi:hypothetical protein